MIFKKFWKEIQVIIEYLKRKDLHKLIYLQNLKIILYQNKIPINQ